MMGKKWNKVLVLVVAFTILTPLVAMDGANNTAPITPESADQIVNKVMQTIPEVTDSATNTVSESTSSFWGNLWGGIQSTSSLAWSSLTSAGSAVRGHYFEKPESWEGFSKRTVALDVFLGISACFIGKHYFGLRAIDMKIGTSEVESASGSQFLFGSWKCKADGYKTAKDISDNANTVKKKLWSEVGKVASRIHIMNQAGTRIDSKNVTKSDLLCALNKEKEDLRKDLDTISYLTDAPKGILELARVSKDPADSNVSEDSYLWYQDAAFHQDAIDYLKELDVKNLIKFGNDLIAFKCNSYIKHALFVAPGWSFWRVNRWRWGIWYSKASALYWKVYTRYLRTCALYDILSCDKSIKDSKKPALQKLLDQVEEMIRNQDNAYNDGSTKLAQYGRLARATDNFYKKVKNKYSAKHSQQIESIESNLKSINMFLQDNEKKPQNDTAGTSLDTVKGNLKEIIKKEKVKS